MSTKQINFFFKKRGYKMCNNTRNARQWLSCITLVFVECYALFVAWFMNSMIMAKLRSTAADILQRKWRRMTMLVAQRVWRLNMSRAQCGNFKILCSWYLWQNSVKSIDLLSNLPTRIMKSISWRTFQIWVKIPLFYTVQIRDGTLTILILCKRGCFFYLVP